MRILGEVHALRDVNGRDEVVSALGGVDGHARDVQHVRAEEVLILRREVRVSVVVGSTNSGCS